MNEQYVSALADLFLLNVASAASAATGWRATSPAGTARGVAQGGPPRVRPLWDADGLRDLRLRRVQGSGLWLRERPRAAAVRGRRRGDGARPEVPRLREGRREGSTRRSSPRAGPRGGAGHTSFRYARSGAQDSGSGRAHGSREAGERRGRLQLTQSGAACGAGPSSSTTSVFTTGATMSSCAETLLRGEVKKEVYAMGLCRTE